MPFCIIYICFCFRLDDLDFIQAENVILTYSAIDVIIDDVGYIKAAFYISTDDDNALCSTAYGASETRRRKRNIQGI